MVTDEWRVKTKTNWTWRWHYSSPCSEICLKVFEVWQHIRITEDNFKNPYNVCTSVIYRSFMLYLCITWNSMWGQEPFCFEHVAF